MPNRGKSKVLHMPKFSAVCALLVPPLLALQLCVHKHQPTRPF